MLFESGMSPYDLCGTFGWLMLDLWATYGRPLGDLWATFGNAETKTRFQMGSKSIQIWFKFNLKSAAKVQQKNDICKFFIGYGLRVTGYGLWVTGYGLWVGIGRANAIERLERAGKTVWVGVKKKWQFVKMCTCVLHICEKSSIFAVPFVRAWGK